MIQLRARAARRKWLASGSLHTRLTVLYTALFALVIVTMAGVAQLMILNHSRNSVRAELVTSGSVFDRVWALRTRSLSDSADVLAHDFGFRSAVASGDVPTIASALVSLRQRSGASGAFVVTEAGDVIGDGDATLKKTVAALPFRLDSDRREAVTTSGGAVYRMVVSPILAPMELGWVVFAIPLNAAEMQTLEDLSAIPLTATVLHRTGKRAWIEDGPNADPPSSAIDGFIDLTIARRATGPGMLTLNGRRSFVLAKPFAGPGAAPEAALLLSYPLAKALAPYRALQAGIGLVGLIGLLLVIWGSRRLARGIARPIVALDAAARLLETGERTEVAVVGSDEIGRLAETFNRMSATIVEREHRITHLAFHDALTGLPNRVLFREELDSAIVRAANRRGQVAILCLDLDGFKAVNDTLGHPIGDALLQIIGGQLRDMVADGVVARLGGDEFAIILETPAGSDRPRALAQQIVDRLQEPMSAAGHHIVIATSIGIALWPDDGDDADTLLKNADLALYLAKQDGRAVYRFFKPALDAAARHRRMLELDLRKALADGQFRLAFQPIYDLRNDRIGGFEALLRWHHPERGLISPVEFIPIAEETGLIMSIGEWVMHEATRTAMRWPGHLKVAVNVSPLQFRNSGFLNIVVQALAHSRLAPNRLEVEITESVFLEGTTSTLAVLHQLRALSVRVALDDFGTGYSSLSYLRSFPFDKIKIDRSFITSIAKDPTAAAIVRSIIDLATVLHMETTAEGVEDAEQWSTLQSQGCSSIQGFLFSRPVEASAVLPMLNKSYSVAA